MDTESSTSSGSGDVVIGDRGRGRGRRRSGRRGTRSRGHRGGRGQVGQGRGALTEAGQASVRSAETEEQRKERVKELVASLEGERAKEILCLAVDRQPGLILDILDRVEPAQPGGFHPRPGGSSPPWCSCNRCRDMPTVEERVCCGYMPEYCLSQLPDMEQYILDEGVLSLARLYRREILVYPDERDLCKANRHAAYRQFTLWRHGRLGQGVRLVIPSCCVWLIRDRYPDPYGQYTGFKPSRLG